jgi:hypothetical protein
MAIALEAVAAARASSSSARRDDTIVLSDISGKTGPAIGDR